MPSSLAAAAALFSWFFPMWAQAPIAPLPAYQHLADVRAVPNPFGAPEEGRFVVLFGGDMMFDRYIRQQAELNGGGEYTLSCLAETLRDADLVVANLEGPITPYPSMSAGSVIRSPENYTFTFPTSTAQLLARHNIGIVNIGNNHIMNFGRDGLWETKKWLDAAGVRYFGDPEMPEAARVVHFDIKGVRYAFVNWSDWTSDKTDHTVAQVRAEREAGRVPIVYTHWGEEYATTSSPRNQQLARSFVDAGAEMVIGSHPHVIQEHEEYNGKHIYYSLGNMVFDQYWNEAVRTGLMLRVTFGPRGVETIEEIKVEMLRDGRTCPKELEG